MTGRRAATAAGGALLAGLALLGSGCSADAGGSKDSSSAARPAMAGDAAGGSAVKRAPSAATSAIPAAARDARSIAYTADLRLEAKDVTAALERLRTLTTGAGGYVSSETVSRGGAEPAAGSDAGAPDGSHVVVKVPSAAFDRTLDRFGQLGRVLQRHREAEDVTDRVVDVESRLRTQRTSVERVRKLMDRAATITDVVALEGELSRREADLESLERQQQELASRTSLSTITVDLYSVAPPAPAVRSSRGFGSAVGHALAGGWHALYMTVRGLLVAVAAAAPFAAVLVPAGWLAARLWRRRRTPRPVLAGSAAASGEPGEPGERPQSG